jgi:hypothetical protein
MDSYDFWEDGCETMLQEQKKQNSSSEERFPVTYVGTEGTYIFRIYPENYKGTPRLFRTVWSNRLHNNRRVISEKEDRRIDDLVQKAKDNGWDSKKEGFWKHKTKQEGIMMAYLISAPEGKYIAAPNSATALVLGWQHLQSLDMFLQDLEKEGASVMKLLHPGKPNPAIKMIVRKVTKGKKSETQVNCSFTASNDFELPPLSETLPEGIKYEGLDQIHVSVDSKLTDEMFDEFKKYYDEKVQKIIEFASSEAYDPKNQNLEQGYKPVFDDDEEENTPSTAAK